MRWTRQLSALTSPTQQWNVGIVDKPIHTFIEDKTFKIRWFSRLDKEYFLADPFGARINNEPYIFMEKYDRAKRKGKICYVKLGEEDELKIRTAFNPPYHISYPYLFQYEDEVYCIPEAHVINEAAIYKLRSPSDWRKEFTIIKGIDVVDASLVEFGGKWWLFFSRDKVSERANLYIWYAEDLFGEWKPHKNNPVKSDIRSSKPAGTMFVHKGALYRPVQDCGEYYGANVIINKVVELSPTEFLEVFVSGIIPNDTMVRGYHTLSSLGDVTLIDGFRFIGRDRLWLKDRILTIAEYLSRSLKCC